MHSASSLGRCQSPIVQSELRDLQSIGEVREVDWGQNAVLSDHIEVDSDRAITYSGKFGAPKILEP
jgi:hypothetical protein